MIAFLRTRGRPLAVGGCFLWVLALFVIATHLSAQLNVEEGGLVIAVLLMLAAIPFHWFGDRKNALYVVSLTLNAVGMGFSAGAYYSVTGLSAAFSALLPALLLPLFLLAVWAALLPAESQRPRHRRVFAAGDRLDRDLCGVLGQAGRSVLRLFAVFARHSVACHRCLHCYRRGGGSRAAAGCFLWRLRRFLGCGCGGSAGPCPGER